MWQYFSATPDSLQLPACLCVNVFACLCGVVDSQGSFCVLWTWKRNTRWTLCGRANSASVKEEGHTFYWQRREIDNAGEHEVGFAGIRALCWDSSCVIYGRRLEHLWLHQCDIKVILYKPKPIKSICMKINNTDTQMDWATTLSWTLSTVPALSGSEFVSWFVR